MEIEKSLQVLESMKRSQVLASVLNHTDHEALSNAIAIIKAAKAITEHPLSGQITIPFAMSGEWRELLDLLSPSPTSEGEQTT